MFLLSPGSQHVCTCLIAILSRHRDLLYQDESELFLNVICLCAGSIAHMGPGEGSQEAAFPATESARTSRDLAPDASFAAQAGWFLLMRWDRWKRNFAARSTRIPRATCRDDALLTICLGCVFVMYGKADTEIDSWSLVEELNYPFN